MSSREPGGSGLYGRRSERQLLDRLVGAARNGNSQVLVLEGEAGIGKTALLEYLTQHAAEVRLLRATGAESEMELPFAGLHQLCAPVVGQLDGLPAPQRDALATAFGLISGSSPNRFLVGLAVLTLLSRVAAERPVLCLVDDGQWLDRVSAQTLAFVARRLMAEPVAMVFAVREASGNEELAGLPALQLRGLPDSDARSLLESAVVGRIDEQVRDRIVAESWGNPLALIELSRELTVEQLAGGFALPDLRSPTGRVEATFLNRLQSLPPETQRLLLVAAAEPVGDLALLLRAADRLQLSPASAAPAEAAGLIELGAHVRFRHPLVRSAAYRAASPTLRREAHRALADATDPVEDPDRRAWHRASAASGPDEDVAAELERSATRAEARGGVAAAAAFLARAAELTPEPAHRGRRRLAAAEAKLQAGSIREAGALLAAAEAEPISELDRARVTRMYAQMSFGQSRGHDAATSLLLAARRLEPLDSGLARETHLEALGAVIFAGRLSARPDAREAAAAALAAPPGPQPPRVTDLLLDGVATRLANGYATGTLPLKRALEALQQEAARAGGDVMSWLWLACPVAPEPVAPELWDYDAWRGLATRAVQLARAAGALGALPVALSYRAGVHVHAGEFAAAAGLIDEAESIARATGDTPLRYTSLMLLAWRGDETRAVEAIEADTHDATARGEGRALGLAGYAAAVLHNGLGHYPAAVAHARRACEYDDLGFLGWSLAELVEAAAGSGDHGLAGDAVDRLEGRTRAAGSDWALGILARSKALVAGGPAAEELYREALERLGRTAIVPQLARTHLLYGEWLRRQQRRVDARDQLRVAHDLLSRVGAEAFAERAHRELRSSGETARRPSPLDRVPLTAQEERIARLAGGGLTNPEIGAQLFLSPHTVEWHLRKVFAKLGVTSRKQLRAELGGTAAAQLA